MELTMLRQTSREARLRASLQDNHVIGDNLGALARILEPKDAFGFMNSATPMTGKELAEAYKSGQMLSDLHYKLLLQYINATGRMYLSAYAPSLHTVGGTPILPISAKQPRQHTIEDRTYSLISSHEGNSHIMFYVPGDVTNMRETGYIEAIWEMPLDGLWQTFFLVRQHQSLSPTQLRKVPYFSQPTSYLQTKVVKSEPSNLIFIIEPQHIISHVAIYKRPQGTYGVNRDIMTVCWALNRGRK